MDSFPDSTTMKN